MYRHITLVTVFLLATLSLISQNKFQSVYSRDNQQAKTHPDLNLGNLNQPVSNNSLQSRKSSYDKIKIWNDAALQDKTQILIAEFEESRPIWVKVKPSSKITKSMSLESQVFEIISDINHLYKIKNPSSEFLITDKNIALQSNEHIKLQQYYKGIKVQGAELRAHAKNGVIELINGLSYPTPEISITSRSIGEEQAIEKAKTEIGYFIPLKEEHSKLIGMQQISAELVIYHAEKNANKEKLSYRVTVFPNLREKWVLYIDAIDGTVIHKYKDSCQFFHDHNHVTKHNSLIDNGPLTANETDLGGRNVNLNVYEEGGVYYLLNVSEKMFNSNLSDLPNEPVGGILTLDALNTSPQNDDFVIDHVTDNNNIWNNPIATSAHSNATIVYSYFEDNFTRLSFDNKGGTIYSMINVSEEDGKGMDNAFWNGVAMFYGNGDQAFNKPLAAALDVAAHEFSHGVIQHEANLEYENESGALNESFADIFGVLVDRNDWTLGEDIVNKNIFKTGALRSLADPHNGGNSLNDNGWQPRHVNERYQGKEDNGGVHINSGITNYAFYLFANNTNVGLARAEKIYYKALSEYLVSTSGFAELRLSIEQSIKDIHGNNTGILNAFNNAFDAVGITSTGSSLPTGEPEIFQANQGQDFVIWYNENAGQMNIRTVSSQVNNIISNRGLYNTPSASDDGSIIAFIGLDQKMYALTIDWTNGNVEEILIEDQTKWRNVAISKDGTKIAAVDGSLETNDFTHEIFVFDFVSRSSRWFELTNPTTAQGVSTGDVLFADALEWDHSGEYVMYDASNQIISLFNDPFNYWDIGFIEVWDNSTNRLSDGRVFKLFPSLPENVSIGNPTFSKNSPDIIAFDLLDSRNGTEEYSILGVNLINGDQGLIFENSTLGYPNFSSKDDAVIFNATTTSGAEVIASISLNTDFINGKGAPSVLVSNATWGVWFNNGQRDLSTATSDPIIVTNDLTITPNPTESQITIRSNDVLCQPCEYEIFNLNGQLVLKGTLSQKEMNIDVNALNKGIHQLILVNDQGQYLTKFVKL